MQKNKKSTLGNMLLSLLIVTLVAGLSLSFVNELTKEPKAKAKLENKINALRLVLPSFDNNPIADKVLIKKENIKDSVEIFPAFFEKELTGIAIIGSSKKGFSGLIKLMIGFDTTGAIQNIVVLEQKETPGLGTRMKDEKYIKQYRNKNPSKNNLLVTKDGGKIDALTGATITSRAFSESVQMAYAVFEHNKDKIKKKEKKENIDPSVKTQVTRE